MQITLRSGLGRPGRFSWGRLAAGCAVIALTLLLPGPALRSETPAPPQSAIDARVEVRVDQKSAGCVSFWLPPTVDAATAEELAARAAEAQGWAVQSLLVDSGEYGTWVELCVDGLLSGAGTSRKFQLDLTSIAALLNRYGVSSFELAVGAARPYRLRLSSGSERVADTEISEFSDRWHSWISVDLSTSEPRRGDLLGRSASEGARAGATGVLEFEVTYPVWPAIWRLLLIAAAVFAVQTQVRALRLRADGIAAIPIVFERLRVLACPTWGLAPVEDGAVADAVRELAEKAGIRIEGAYVAKAGRLREANAGMMTIARRIVLTDRLLSIMPKGELSCVIGRELARIKLAWRVHLADAIDSLVKAALIAGLCEGLAAALFKRELPPEAMAFLVAGLVFAAGQTALNHFRRVTEFQADRFAVELTGDPESCVKAHYRLALLDTAPMEGRGWVIHHVKYPSMWEWIRETAANVGVDEARLSELMREVETDIAL